MIPYFEIKELNIVGPLSIQPFGLLVVVGLMVGQWYVRRIAKEAHIDDKEIVEAIVWTLVGGFICAHLVAVIFYFPNRLAEEGPILLFKVWKYLSSVGGFLGAFIGITLWQKKSGKKRWLPHMQILTQGLVVGWVFGRLACTVAHDHPGRFSDFFLAVQYPEGARHDLGFYEFLFTLFIMLPVMLGAHRLKLPTGATLAIIFMIYAPPRFLLDFLRKEEIHKGDMRYLGLTPAQYATIALLGIGIVLFIHVYRKQAEPEMPLPTKKKRKEKKRRKGKGKQ